MNALRKSVLASLAAALFLATPASASDFLTGAVSAFPTGWSVSDNSAATSVAERSGSGDTQTLAFALGEAQTLSYTPANPSDAGGTADVVISNAVFTTAYEYPGVEAVGGIDSQAAICVYTNTTSGGPLQYYGWAGDYTGAGTDTTNLTWVALTGATPVEGATNTVTMSFDYTTSPATVTFKVGNTTLTPNPVQLVNNTKTQVAGVSFSGTGSIGELTGETLPAAPSEFLVSFFDEGAASACWTTSVVANTAPAYAGPTLTKESTAQYTYEFAGWTNAASANAVVTLANETIVSVTNYYATYTPTIRQYTVTFKDGETTVSSAQYDYNTPAASVVVPADRTKDPTASTVYSFGGWGTIADVTDDATYNAVWNESTRQYTVTFKDGETTVSSAQYDYNTPAASVVVPADRTKDPDSQYTYTFLGWGTITDVTDDATYTAQFEAHEIVVPTLALLKPTLSSTALANAQSGAVVRATIDPAATVTGASATTGVSVDVDGATATFTSLPWNEAVDWTLSATDAADLPGRFYAKGETSWFNVATDALDTVTDLVEGMKGVDMSDDPSAAGQMVRIQTCLEIPEGAMEELPDAQGVGSARTGFAVAQIADNGDTAPAFYAFNGTTWDKLLGVAPVANTTNDLLIVLDVQAGTARYYVDGIALYKDNAGAPAYAIPMKAFGADEAKQINGIGFANADGVKAPVVAEYDVPFEAAVGDVPYAAAADGLAAADKTGVRTLYLLTNDVAGTIELGLDDKVKVDTTKGSFVAGAGVTLASTVPAGYAIVRDPATGNVATYTVGLLEYPIEWKLELAGATNAVANALTNSYTVADLPITLFPAGCEGYTFIGWTNNVAAGVQTTIPAGTTGAVTNWATWKQNAFTITWNVEGVTTTSEVLPGVAPTFTGTPEKAADNTYTYTFLGWAASAGGSVIAELPGASADATYFAIFEPVYRDYTITWKFKAADGTDTSDTSTVHWDAVPSHADPAGYVANNTIYAFDKWSPAPAAYDGTVTAYTAIYNSTAAKAAVITVAGDVATTNYYATLAAAIGAVPGDGTQTTVTLLADVSGETIAVNGGRNVVLDLGGKELEPGFLYVLNGALEAKNGTVAGTVYVYGLDEDDSGMTSSFTLASDATVDSENYGIILNNLSTTSPAYDASIDIQGTVKGCVWVMGNIKEGDSVINVSGTVDATGRTDIGIALNGVATVNVLEGAVVTSKDPETNAGVGIEVRAGTLNVSGGTITGTGSFTEPVANGSGTTSAGGAAVVVSQHTTDLPISVTISGGRLVGEKAFYETDTVASETPSANVTASITGGTIDGAVETQNLKTVIPGTSTAKFSDSEAEGLAAGYYLSKVEGSTNPVLYEVAARKSVIGTVITVAENVIYDGTTQYANIALVVKPTADGTALVLDTDYIAVFATNALVNAGDYNVKVVGVGAWMDETNVTFKVAKRPVTFTGASDTKVYDGTALVKNDFSTSNLVSGHEATATVAGSQTDVGVSSNVVSAAAVKDANDNDVTANYMFTYVDGELKVTPAAMAITIAGVDSTSVYTGAEQTTNVAWTATSETVGFVATKVSYTGDVSVAGTDVADYAYNLDATKFVYADDNFTATFTVDPDGKFAITPAKIAVPTAVAGLVYDGTEKTGVEPGTGYTLEGNTATAAGGYTATATLAANYAWEDETLSGPQTVAWSIGKATVAVTAENKTQVYGEAAEALTYTTDPATLIEGNSFSGALAREEGDDVGPYAITQGTLSAGDNYEIDFTGATYTITAAPMTITVAGYNGVYDGAAHEASATTVPDGATVTWSTDGGETWSDTVPSVTGVTNVTIVAKATLDNYADATATTSLVVTAKAVALTAASDTKVYDGTALVKDAFTSDGLVEGHTATATVTGSQTIVGASSNVVSAAVIKDAGDNDVTANYDVTYKDGELKVTAATVDIPAAPANKVYNGKNQTAEVTAPETVTVTNAGGKDAGGYTVTFALADPANYTWSDGSVTNQVFGWSITKKALKLIAEDKEVAHGAAAPAYTYKVDETDGLVEGDSLTTEPTLSCAYVAGNAVGTYPIAIADAVAPNYAITYANGTLTVVSNTFTVIWLADDGTTEIDRTQVEWGETPTHADAEKSDATGKYAYEFAAWTPAPGPVTEATNYVASFTQSIATPLELPLANHAVDATVNGSTASVALSPVGAIDGIAFSASPATATLDDATGSLSFSGLDWNEAVAWSVSAAQGEAELAETTSNSGKFYVKPETQWFTATTNQLVAVADASDAAVAYTNAVASNEGEMVRVHTKIAVPAGGLPAAPATGTAKVGFAVLQLENDTAPAYYAYGNGTWTKLSGAKPTEGDHDYLAVYDLAAETPTARYYIDGVALYKPVDGGDDVYALPLGSDVTSLKSISFASKEMVKSDIVAEQDVSYVAAVDTTPYTEIGEALTAAGTAGEKTLALLKAGVPLDPAVSLGTGEKLVVDYAKGSFTNETPIVSGVAGYDVKVTEAETVKTYELDPIVYPIEYVLGGGVNDASNTNEYTVADLPLALADASRTGYTFTGWTNNVSANAVATSIPVGTTGAVTNVATWTINSYALTINYLYTNGTVAATQFSSNVVYDTAYSVDSPVIAGYTADKLLVSGKMGAAPVTVDVTYTVNRHTVAFVDEDGTVLKAATEYDYGTPADAIAKPETPTKAATAEKVYTFAGWTPAIEAVTSNAVYKASYSEADTKAAVITVAQDGTTNTIYVATIADAIAAAGDDDTIQLIGAVEGDATIEKDVTIDLNGNTWTGDVSVAGDVTIVDGSDDADGKLDGTVAVAEGGSVEVSGGIVDDGISGAGKVVVSGGTVNGGITGSGEIAVSGGTVNGGITGSGEIAVSGGTVNGGVVAKGEGAVATVKGGTVSGGIAVSGGATGTISGEDTVVNGDLSGTEGALVVTGGHFEKDPSDNVADGYVAVADTPSGYKVQKGKSVIGTTITVAGGAYTGSAYKIGTVVLGDYTLTADDYTVYYENVIDEATTNANDNINAGMVIATIAGKGEWIDSTNVTFTITPVEVTVTASDKKVRRGTDPATLEFAVSYSGFVNNETEAVLTTAATADDAANASDETYSAASLTGATFPIVARGAAAANYTFKYVDGTLTVVAGAIAAVDGAEYDTIAEAVAAAGKTADGKVITMLDDADAAVALVPGDVLKIKLDGFDVDVAVADAYAARWSLVSDTVEGVTTYTLDEIKAKGLMITEFDFEDAYLVYNTGKAEDLAWDSDKAYCTVVTATDLKATRWNAISGTSKLHSVLGASKDVKVESLDTTGNVRFFRIAVTPFELTAGDSVEFAAAAELP